MKAFVTFIGWAVIVLWGLGMLGLLNFSVTVGPATRASPAASKSYTCQSGDSLFSRKKYECAEAEFNAQQG